MIRILYFLEDRMQEDFIASLVNRVAKEENIQIENEVRWASGGSQVKRQFKKFLKNTKVYDFDLLIVAMDGNCKGHMEKEKEITKSIPEDIKDKLICCIPDPHIERWYLLDLNALKRAIGENIQINQLPQKCEKDYYKSILGNALRSVGSLLGGPEYAERLVENLDLHILQEKDKGFKRFIDELRRKIRFFNNR